MGRESSQHSHDRLDKFKSWLKQFPHLYSFLIAAISPVYSLAGKRQLRSLIKEAAGLSTINVGSGANRLSDSIVNIDITPYSQVDVLADAESLPIADGTVDLAISIAVLEHVRDPKKVMSEITRVLKPGGFAFISVPFIQGFHASPHDYTRFTLPGLELLCEPLMVVRRITVGPTGSLVWITAEWLAIVFCFGSSRLQTLFAVAFTTLLSPLKFADVILRFMPGATNISTAFSLVLRKL
jgi:SAM-dependent methyltransferase